MKQTATEITKKILFLMVGLLCAVGAQAQTIAVSGTVIDSEGEPLIGASVIAEGSQVGTATDFDGNFQLNVPSDAVLIVSYVGYDTQRVPVNGRNRIDITLQDNSVMLNEVVAIGYGTVKKSDATGSVSVIKPDEIEAGLASSAQDMLVGAAPGVVVTTTGAPQGGANIVIRGGASLAASNEPLIVIDGVPMDRSSVTGSSNPLSLVSPENIESMTVLKDASATAIYGSRASNGVIIITTKKGQSGRPQVNFAANVYVNTPRNTLDMMDGGQFADFIRNTYGADSKQAQALYGYNTDWQKEVLRTSVSSDYNLSVGGTAGVLPYRVAVSYTNNNGIIRTSKMDRATASINLTPKFFGDLLSVNANVKGAYIANGYTKGGVLNGAISYNPTLPVKNPDGNVFNNWTTYVSGATLAGPGTPGTAINTIAGLNPRSLIDDYSSKSKVYQSVGNLQLDLKMPFLTDLRANLNLGYDYSHGECTSYDMPFSPSAWKAGYRNPQDVDVKNGYTGRSKENQERMNLLLDFYLNYTRQFDAIHSNIDLTAGYSWQHFKTRSHNFSQVYIPEKNEYNAAYYDTDNGYQSSPTYYYSVPHQLLSFFGRLNYTFYDKYLLTVTVRRDGTSRFSKDHRWGTFPAVALGWKLLDESFMEGARDFMSELKIRAGYGVTGQQDLNSDYFPYLPVYGVSTSISERYPSPDGSGTIALVTPGAYNNDLKWEETTTWNAGIDFGFLNGRINGSIEYYKRKTKDLLTYANYAAGSNLTNMGNMNLGDLENEGVEFNIVTRPIVGKTFTWTSSANVAWNRNKITRLADGADTTTGGIGNGVNIQKHEVGKPAFSFWVYEQVYNDNGDPVEGVFVDRNGDGVLTDADKYLYHSRSPKVTLTWNNNFNYKNWDLGIVLRANIGNWVYNSTLKDNCFTSATSTAPLSNLLADTYLFTSTRTTEMICSDYFVQNASFVRCDNITLGYTWPELLNDNLRLRLYGAVQNPFVITKYKGLDPEVFSGIDNDVYPRPVTFTLGVVATF